MSDIYSKLTKDDPVSLPATWSPTAADRREVDNQIQGLEQHVVDSLLSGVTCVWARATGATVSIGDCVVLSSAASPDSFPYVNKASYAGLVDAGLVFGVAVSGGVSGSLIRIATAGMLRPEITGLSGSAGSVRCNTTTGRCERVASFITGDSPVGMVNSGGILTMCQSYIR